jgi:acyl-CoA thioesterase II
MSDPNTDTDIDIDLPESLSLDRVDETHFVLPRHEEVGIRRDVITGSHLLARMMIASHQAGDRTKDVKSAHAVFARPASFASDVEIEVERIHAGRGFASDVVRAQQNGVQVSSAIILWSLDEPDLIRHADPMPEVPGPETLADSGAGRGLAPDMRTVGGVDTWAVDSPAGPAELFTWTRNPTRHDEVVVNQALLCSATGALLIGTALRPHAGINQDMAHRQISTGVVGHTINFHDRFDVADWLLLAQDSPWAGRGRSHGRGLVFTRDGKLVASYTQDNMIRHFTDAKDHSTEYRTIM